MHVSVGTDSVGIGRNLIMVHPKYLVLQIVILQLLAVSVFCGQGWKHIPEIPAGRRAQYQLLKRDGGYKYGYDTGDGSSAFQSATGDNEVVGNYAYVGGDGLQQEIQYKSGVDGFVPHVSPSRKLAGPLPHGSLFGSPQTYTVTSVGEGSADSSHNFGSGGQAQDESSGDASYSFQYSSDSHSRQESSDAQGNVQGTYSYVDPTGTQQKIDYTASDQTGFTVKDLSAPTTSAFSKAAVQQTNVGLLAGKPSIYYIPSPGLSTPDVSSIMAVTPSSVQESVPYTPTDFDESGPSDASYSFSYQTLDHSRQESSDAAGNVQGSFSFTAKDDGLQRRVNYIAGANTGFVASGAHLPTPVPPQSPSAPELTSIVTKTQPSFAPDLPSISAQSPPFPTQAVPYSPSGAGIQSGTTDGSYSFAYNAGDHSRSETGDASGNIKGSFSFKANDDGLQRRLYYVAGANTGFVASGAHLPTPVPPQASSAPDLPSVVTKTQPSFQPYVPSIFGQSPTFAPQPGPYSLPAAGIQSGITDGSYSFAYDAGDHSRSETGDASGNIKGTFSFKPKDDGLQRRVDYIAGANTGFVASGSHLPTPVPPQAASAPDLISIVTKTQPSFAPDVSTIFAQSPTFAPQLGPYSPPAAGKQSGITEGSYSFAYDAGDHSRSETGDASGNIKGSFSFKPKDDGLQRRVDYIAGANTGFVASGSHLPTPVPPQAASAPDLISIVTKTQPSFAPDVSTIFAQSPTFAPQLGPYSPPAAGKQSGITEGSYSFAYDAGDHSRSETGDASGNIKGSFSFKAKDDGLQRRVNYIAGANTGFVASGAHLPTPVPSAPNVPYSIRNSQTPIASGLPSILAKTPSFSPQSVETENEGNGDASYAYSYETDSSRKQETSDSQGNVAGSFTFLSGDGVSRTVQYTSLGEEGFIATGDHLPKPVEYSPQFPAVNTNAFSVKGSSQAIGSPDYSVKSSSFHTKPLTPGVNAIGSKTKASDYSIHTYLTPDSEKFGYIFDTKRH